MNRIRELRKELSLTMKELGRYIGVAESTISLYESGKREPDNKTLVKLADYFNVSVDYLLGRSDFRNFEEMYDSLANSEEIKKPINEDELDKELLELLTNLNDDDIPVVEAFLSALTKRHEK